MAYSYFNGNPIEEAIPTRRQPPFRPHVRCFAALWAPSPTRGEGKIKTGTCPNGAVGTLGPVTAPLSQIGPRPHKGGSQKKDA